MHSKSSCVSLTFGRETLLLVVDVATLVVGGATLGGVVVLTLGMETAFFAYFLVVGVATLVVGGVTLGGVVVLTFGMETAIFLPLVGNNQSL